MRHTVLLTLLLLALSYASIGQSVPKAKNKIGLDFTIETDTIEVPKYKMKGLGKSKTFLQMLYGSYRIINPENAKVVSGLVVQKVELLYTDYPKDGDVVLLNKKRLAALFLLMPELFDNPLIEWRLVKQTKCKSAEDAVNMFHGFVISYRPQPSGKAEVDYLRRIAKGEEAIEDSTIYKVLDRNKQWKNTLIVADVTGSMSPYMAQLFLWLNLNMQLKAHERFVFFNDDDGNSTTQEFAFDTLGIWDIETRSFDKIIEKAADAIMKGGHTENDLEALFYGLKKYPKADDIILIADHWESPCDMSLIKDLVALKKPIKVILCGATAAVNMDYLEIARATGGSFHTIENDIDMTLKDGKGKIVKILGRSYRIVKDGVVALDGTEE